jgi:chromosome partitioning protein
MLYILHIYERRISMVKIIAFANQKGGVAKTTSCHNIATARALEGKKVLMVDLDPQGSLSIMAACEPYDEKLNGHSINDIFVKGIKMDIHECIFNVQASDLDNLFIIPSNIDLSKTALDLVSRYSREKILKNALKKISGEFDEIYIDCPPELGMLSLNGLCAADALIVPVKADYISYRGLDALLDTIADIKDPNNELNPDLELMGVVVTLYEKNVNDQRDILDLIKDKVEILGVVKKSADAYRGVLDGRATVQTKNSSDVAKSYIEIAKLI